MKKELKRIPITEEDFNKLIKAIPHRKRNIKIRVAFLMAYNYRLKISEVLKYKPRDSHDPLLKVLRPHFLKELPIKKSPRTLQRWFKQYVKVAKLNPKYTFNSLRLKVTIT